MLNPPIMSAAERADVVDLARLHGAAEVARRTGLKAATIRQWVRRAVVDVTLSEAIERAAPSVAAESITAVRAAVEAPAPRPAQSADVDPLLPWYERERRISQALGVLVEQTLAAAGHAIGKGRARDGKDLAVAAAVFIDKARLIEGHATSRTESNRSLTVQLAVGTPDEVAAELERMRADLGLPTTTTPVLGAIEGTATDDDDD